MYQYIKRFIDFFLSLFVLIVISPVFLLISIVIKMESRGPVFFIQKRSGQNGELFNILKFRSMRTGTPDVATDQLANPGQYVTKVGNFIRKSSLDELPQLINILRGEMTLVGPRPALFNQYKLIEKRRLLGIECLRPGLTGYAQIMGRDFITDEQKVAYDKYYLDHISFLLDLKIFLLTFVRVVKAENVIVNAAVSRQNISDNSRNLEG